MKRPLSILGFCALLTMVCLICFENTVFSLCFLILSAVSFVIFSLCKFKQAKSCAVICFGMALACLLFLNGEYNRHKTLALCGENVRVEAVISESPVFSHDKGRYYAVAKLKCLGGEKAYGKIRFSFSETYDEIDAQSLNIGDKISFDGTVYKIGNTSREIHNYYCSIDIYTGAYSVRNLITESPGHRPIYYYISQLKDWMIKKIRFRFDTDTAGVVIAILTGDKDFVSDEIYSSFKTSGAAHIMAVSGMHLSVWILFLSFFLDKLKRHKVLASVLLSAVTLFVMCLASFSPSVMRAGVMVLLHLYGKCIGRETDGLNSLGFAGTVLICLNPYIAVNIGFQLSFVSVLSIFLMGAPISKMLTEKYRHIIPTEPLKRLFSVATASICISLSVTLFTFPIMVHAFGGISLVSPLTNLLLLPVATPLMILSAAFVAFSSVPYLSTFLAFTVKTLAEYTIKVTDFTSSIPMSYMPADYRHIIVWSVLILTILLAAVLVMRKRNTAFRIVTAVIVSAMIFAFSYQLSTSLTQYKITAVKTENDCVCIVSMNGRGVLIGMSEDYYFESSLTDITEELGLTLDAFVYTENTNLYEAEFLLKDYGIEHTVSAEGESVILFGEVTIKKQNNYVLVEGNGISSVIFQNEGLQTDNSCDIIINRCGLVFPVEGDSGDEFALYSDNTDGFTVTVNKKGEYSFGR